MESKYVARFVARKLSLERHIVELETRLQVANERIDDLEGALTTLVEDKGDVRKSLPAGTMYRI